MTDLHLVFTIWDGFVSVESPQIPGLLGGRETAAEIVRDLDDILALAEVDTSSFARVFKHEQKHLTSPAGNEFFLRFAADDDIESTVRDNGTGRMHASILNGSEDDEEPLSRIPVLPTGERLMIAAAGSDHLGWFLDQLGPDEGCVIEWNRDGDAMWAMPIVPSDLRWNDGKSLEELGLSRESTVEQCFDAIVSHEVSDMSRTLFMLPS